MRAWLVILGGLLAWTAHFFAVYAIGSIWPGTETAKWLVGIATLLALAATGWLLARDLRLGRSAADSFGRWTAGLGALGCALALPAILYQGLPALIG